MACEPNSDTDKPKNKPKVQQSSAQGESDALSTLPPAKADNSQGDRIVPNHALPIEQQLGQQSIKPTHEAAKEQVKPSEPEPGSEKQ
ncbi:hypothetical protein GNT65_03150 [Shewanella sp. JBTF-M18]|uniref:Uncharacterized protein n=1 Tax=Shewanella insulae TaxID=2681496 RepID=A0A6L7HVJ9_9GAMM|nr:hypothetical protein [Shewanella insulae]MXR67674.1 hypothetical protein [Shewanella insulae]